MTTRAKTPEDKLAKQAADDFIALDFPRKAIRLLEIAGSVAVTTGQAAPPLSEDPRIKVSTRNKIPVRIRDAPHFAQDAPEPEPQELNIWQASAVEVLDNLSEEEIPVRPMQEEQQPPTEQQEAAPPAEEATEPVLPKRPQHVKTLPVPNALKQEANISEVTHNEKYGMLRFKANDNTNFYVKLDPDNDVNANVVNFINAAAKHGWKSETMDKFASLLFDPVA